MKDSETTLDERKIYTDLSSFTVGDWLTVVGIQKDEFSWVFKNKVGVKKRTFRITGGTFDNFCATVGPRRYGLRGCKVKKATLEEIEYSYWQDWKSLIEKKHIIEGPVYTVDPSLESAIKFGLRYFKNRLIQNDKRQ